MISRLWAFQKDFVGDACQCRALHNALQMPCQGTCLHPCQACALHEGAILACRLHVFRLWSVCSPRLLPACAVQALTVIKLSPSITTGSTTRNITRNTTKSTTRSITRKGDLRRFSRSKQQPSQMRRASGTGACCWTQGAITCHCQLSKCGSCRGNAVVCCCGAFWLPDMGHHCQPRPRPGHLQDSLQAPCYAPLHDAATACSC